MPQETQTILSEIVRLGTPYLDAEAANQEIVRLTIENMRLQAEIDRLKEYH